MTATRKTTMPKKVSPLPVRRVKAEDFAMLGAFLVHIS